MTPRRGRLVRRKGQKEAGVGIQMPHFDRHLQTWMEKWMEKSKNSERPLKENIRRKARRLQQAIFTEAVNCTVR